MKSVAYKVKFRPCTKMDVTMGLIKKLVKSKSVERAIAPIAAQVSLLVVTAEQRDGREKKYSSPNDQHSDLNPNLVNCASKIMAAAVQKFITEGEKHGQKSQNQEFIKKVSSANENLTVTIDQLLIVAHRFESGRVPDNVKHTLCQAAKDVLQGVIKVLLVVDDFHVQGLLNKTDAVITSLKAINVAQDYSQIKKQLAFLAVSVMSLRALLFKRSQNLCSKACSDQLTIWGNVLQSSTRVLHQLTKTCSQYPSNLSAKASYDSVEQEMIQACQKIKQLLTSGPEDSVDDTIISFVGVVDQLMDMLTDAQEGSLHEDAESNIVTVVQHSMSVAHCCTAEVYRDLIMASCQRILHLKFRLTELHDAFKAKPTIPHMRGEFAKLCETVLDEICDLEKHVTMALLNSIIEFFLCPKEKVMKLQKVAFVQNSAAQYSDVHNKEVQEFIEYTENFAQLALLVASSSTDNAKVREIITAVKGLESIEVELGPAVVMNSKDPKNRSSNKHLELILGRWSREVKTIMDAVDKLVDPRVFMEMTESLLSKEVERFKNMEGASHDELLDHNYRVRNLVNRPKVIAEKVVDESSDPIYRNGLRCFIKALTDSVSDADAVYKELLQTRQPSSQQHDTVYRRLNIVLQALKNLREGLDVNKHPHVMSKERLTFHTRNSELEDKLMQARKVLKLHEKDPKVKLNNETQTKGVNTDTDHVTKGVNIDTDYVDTVKEKIYKDDNTHQSQTAEASTETERDTEEKSVTIQLESTTTKPGDSLITLPEVFKEKEREGGATAEIYGLMKALLIVCISRDQKSMQDHTHSLLSWTNHIVENAEAIASHCLNVLNRSELIHLSQVLDKTSTEVMLRAKYVVAGDMSLVKELLVTSVLWAQQLTRARLITDVAADAFITMTSELCRCVQQGSESDKNLQMAAISETKKHLCSLLTSARSVTAKYLDHGAEKFEFLCQSQDDIENLTATIKTSVDVSSVSAIKAANDWWQFRMACHDWSVLMTCALAECEDLCDKLEALGHLKFRGLQNCLMGRDPLKTCDIMERETNVLLELTDCVVLGDATLKERSELFVSELQSALTGAWAVAKRPANKGYGPLLPLLDRLNYRVAYSVWVEKAMDVKNFIRNNCFDHMGFVCNILLDAQSILDNNDFPADVKTQKRYNLASQLLDKSNELKQKVLKAMQLSPDLARRAVIRSTLDDLAKLTSESDHLIREKCPISNADVDYYTEQWGGKMKKLLANLKRMEGIRQTAVTELESLNNKVPTSGGELNNKSVFDLNQRRNPLSQSAANKIIQEHPLTPSQHRQEGLIDMPQALLTNPASSSQLPSANLTQSLIYQPVDPPAQFTQEQFPSFLPSGTVQLNIQNMSQPPFIAPPAYQFSSPLGAHTRTVSHPARLPRPLLSIHNTHARMSHQETMPSTLVQKTPHSLQAVPSGQYPQFVGQPGVRSAHPQHSLAVIADDRARLEGANSYVHELNTSNIGNESSLQLPSHRTPESVSQDTITNSPMGKSVGVLLKDAQYLAIRLHKWQEKMTHLEAHERSAVVNDALEMARLCSEMAMFTKGQGSYKVSSEVTAAASSVVRLSKNIEAFANKLHCLAGPCWLADHLKMCILKMNGCSSQLQVIATALHNSPKSHQGDRILVRNASNLLTTVRQMFALVESIAAMGIPEPSSTDKLTNEIISLLVKIRLENENYVRDERSSSQVDELGLRRVELHNPPSLSSLIKVRDVD